MSNLIREKHKFLYHGEYFYCGDLTVEDYLLISINTNDGLNKILSEYNEKLPKLNNRQIAELFKILFGQESKKGIIEKLTENEKKIKAYKEKQKIKKSMEDLEQMLEDWHIIEGQVMHFLNQSLSEIRKRPYQYFMKIYKDLAYCTGAKEYEKNRNSQIPDKQSFKKEFGTNYNK